MRGLAVFPHGHGLNQEIRQFVDVGLRAGFIPLNDRDVYWFLNRYSPPKGWHLQFYNAENDRKKGGGGGGTWVWIIFPSPNVIELSHRMRQ